METTTLSSKGQVVLPKSVREARAWSAGTRFSVETTPDGVLLRPLMDVPPTRLDQVVGCLKWAGEPKSITQMKRGIAREIKRQHDRGRY
jgi:AbrB family looped-hinge helix DNA binding protein